MVGLQGQPPAQQPYPATPGALSNVTALEAYVGNDDPNFGSATPISIPTGTNVSATNTTINFTALPNGVQYLYVRSRDASGKWSLTNYKLFIVGNVAYPPAPNLPSNVTAIEAYVGNDDPNFGGGTIFPTIGTDVSINNATLNFTAQPNGVQYLYVRSRDASGKWSLTNFKQFTVGNFSYPPAPNAASGLSALEIYVGNDDPNFGGGTILPISGTDASVNNATINFTAQPNGVQYVYVRSRDLTGKWSLTNFKQFNVGNFSYPPAPNPVSSLSALEVFVGDADPNFGAGTVFPITGTDVDINSATINFTAQPSGVQYVYTRSRDALGRWSLTNYKQFRVGNVGYPATPAAPATVGNLEYYIDTDPDFGSGTPITFAPSTNVQLTNILATISGSLTNGNHIFHIRSKQNPWGLDNAVTFSVGGVVPLTWQFVNAQLQNGQTLVSWGTEQEINTSKFEIERSIDGLRFEKIGEQQAAGNSSIVTKYNYTDLSPVNGFNYYRIKQIDIDGKVSYSTIVKVLNNKNIKEAFIAPNPVVNMLNLIEPKNIFINSVEVYDSKGSMVLRKNINGEVQVYNLPVANLVNGNYVLKVRYKNASKIISFIK